MRQMTRLLTTLTLLAFVGTAVMPVLAQATGYKLRRVFKVNDIRNYKRVMCICMFCGVCGFCPPLICTLMTMSPSILRMLPVARSKKV